jgi:hypothetical protein
MLFPIVNHSSYDLADSFGVVVDVFPDRKSQTAVVCIKLDDDGHEDYRAIWSEAANLHKGDTVIFHVIEALDGPEDDDDTHYCISSLSKTNSTYYMTEIERLCL